MASLDKQNEQNSPRGGRKYPQEDAEIAARMMIQMLNEGNGLQTLQQAIEQSQDPAEVIGQFLSQMIGQLAEQLVQEANIDPGVFLAKGGALEAVLNYIEGKLGYPPEFSDQVFSSVVETIKAAAMSGQGQQQQSPAQAPPQQAAPPQGGMV